MGAMPASSVAPLAGLLAPGRDALAEELAPGPLVVGPAMRSYVLALLAERAAPLLVVVPTERDAEAVVDGLAAFLGADGVVGFPAWETLPHERLSPQAATVGQRLRVLDRLRKPSEGNLRAVVAPVRALLQPMDPRLMEREPIRLDATWEIGLDGLVDALAALGYARTPMVERRGEFAVRGGLVDVFPSAADHPVRVEFWGDDVDTIREFSAGDQRTVADRDAIAIDAARELVLDAETAATAQLLAERVPALADQLGLLAAGVAFEGMEALVTAIHPAPAYLPDFFPPDAGMAVVDPQRVDDRAAELREQANALLVAGWGTGDSDGGLLAFTAEDETDAVGFAEWRRVREQAQGAVWELGPFGRPDVDGQPWNTFRGDIAGAASTAGRLAGEGDTVVLTTAGHGPALRLSEVLRQEGLAARLVPHVEPGTGGRGSGPGRIVIVESPLREGFRSSALGLAVLAEWDLFGPRRSRVSRRLPSRRPAGDTVLDLAPGDPVVHAVHGIGRFEGMVTRQLPGPTAAIGGGAAGTVTRDYVVLTYAAGDKLFVPSDQVDTLAKYVGGEQPRVMRLGGGEWERAKGKVRKAVKEMAAELIRLYQARMHAPGNAFALDTAWQSELEQAFPFTETDDQLSAINEVKQDMEAPLPMDRLICGDVGYGKTEIAVRAAAKAVFDGKQVAVLVPTTLLAQQHGETFGERFAGFPVNVRVLSRFAGAREQGQILDGLAAGTVDLVIGTHRLLGQDVRFKQLGLVVVDEEQRFGVGHKEKLKQLRTSVDVLTLTATPIPRTMEMAITGIRDLSTIDTPPEERQPIITHVGHWDESLAVLSVRRELLREGQVFWVHNRVQTIAAAAERVRELVPGAHVALAHGQMDEASLEKVMIAFWKREFDVLVSTTIIESGLDIPNANTLIVERAHLLGLAQIYQLRGRVGRASERGYAYLFHPEHQALTEEAYKRLETVATHTGLGSGLSIALRDLEIRGAGNVLSGEQSGHVASVGFEEYARLVKQAVDELQARAGGRAAPADEQVEIRIDLPIDAHLPRDYIDDEALRLDAYRKVASVRDAAGVKAVRAELVDRYGPLPGPGERLLAVAALRAAVRRWGIREITTTPRRTFRVTPVSLSDSQEVRLAREFPQALHNPAAAALELPMPPRGDLVGAVARQLATLLGGAKR
ncbi:transcription-repair coupling factor [soil metagenome]